MMMMMCAAGEVPQSERAAPRPRRQNFQFLHGRSAASAPVSASGSNAQATSAGIALLSFLRRPKVFPEVLQQYRRRRRCRPALQQPRRHGQLYLFWPARNMLASLAALPTARPNACSLDARPTDVSELWLQGRMHGILVL